MRKLEQIGFTKENVGDSNWRDMTDDGYDLFTFTVKEVPIF